MFQSQSSGGMGGRSYSVSPNILRHAAPLNRDALRCDMDAISPKRRCVESDKGGASEEGKGGGIVGARAVERGPVGVNHEGGMDQGEEGGERDVGGRRVDVDVDVDGGVGAVGQAGAAAASACLSGSGVSQDCSNEASNNAVQCAQHLPLPPGKTIFNQLISNKHHYLAVCLAPVAWNT